MASRTIETKAVISAEDRSGPAFAAVVQHMAKMEEAARAASARVQVASTAEGRTGMIAREQRRENLREERRARQEEIGHLRQVQRMQADISGRQMAIGMAGAAIAEQTAHFAHQSLEVYREFDNARRYSKAVMGISDEDQAPLVDQAIHGGGTSKYNDIQWLEAQRNLAARGLNQQQVLALTPIAATLGQAMDRKLEDASSLLEGGMFGFGKDISTYEKAVANAKRTADLQVKASKISGMDFDDVKQAYKYGAAPFRMAGLGEEQLLAFAAVGKKSNMGGDEMGVAARALAANLLRPTAGAKTAMLAAGIDYSKYQKSGTSPMKVGAFADDVAARYGVALSEKAKASLQKVFDDKALVQSAAKFMPAVMKVLGGVLGGSDAKSKAKIAGAAGRYRDASMTGVDAPALFEAVMAAIAKNAALANQLFGSKQGARIRAAIGDPEVFKQKLDQLKNHSDGYAQNVSDQRMAGFDGAVSRFEGAVKNLESALPRAFDNNGKGGLLTDVADAMGRFTQSLAEAPPAVQRLATEAGAAAAAFAGFKGAEALMGGFGLKGAAVELIEAAHMLMGAAGADRTKSFIGPPVEKPAGKPSIFVPIAQVMAYQFGKDAIESGLDALPHPTYPTGYDPATKLHEGPLERIRDIATEIGPALKALKDVILPSARAGEVPRLQGTQTGKNMRVDTNVTVDAPQPLKVQVEVMPGSPLLEVMNQAKTAAVALKAQARTKTDNGPGGLGETHTGQ